MESKTGPSATRNKRSLKLVFGLTSVYLVAEVVGGFMTGSLALLADAGHMFTDVAGVGLALFAMNFADRPATPERTYGYHRVEILAALSNCVVLIGISFYILYEAYGRLFHPPQVQSGAMLVVGAIGLVVNLVSMWVLQSGSEESLNMKGAYFEVLSDMLTSIGVLIAGVIMLTTGWYYADPLISAGIGLFILPRTWGLMKEATAILLEGVPADVSVPALRDSIAAVAGVVSVHDLHVWSLTSGVNAMSGHAVVDGVLPAAELLSEISKTIKGKFNIQHVTIQLEPRGWEAGETHS